MEKDDQKAATDCTAMMIYILRSKIDEHKPLLKAA